MKNKHIRIIIILSCIALTGVLINQGFWINKETKIKKNLIDIQNKNLKIEKIQFDNSVTLALVNVRDKLISLNLELSELYLEPVKQINPNYYVVSFYDTINPNVLENLLIENFKKYNILEKFEYGIYDCFADSIIFDRYVDLSSEKQESGIANYSPIKWNHDGHYFGIYFSDKKENYYLKDEGISYFLIISTLVILLVFIILSYAISVILKQKRLSEIKTDFINNMTHELKTPISTIGISSEALMKDDILKYPNKINQYAKIIFSENKRLEDNVEEILRTSIINESKNGVAIKKENLLINSLIKDIARNYNLSLSNSDGKIICKLNAEKDIVSSDRTHFTNVILNLIDNAIKYSINKPLINIETYNKKDKIFVKIIDNAKGISKAQQKLIFDKFYRVPTGSIHDIKGFGLGLYYVKSILKKLNSEIKVKSEIGNGSEFSFCLDLVNL